MNVFPLAIGVLATIGLCVLLYLIVDLLGLRSKIDELRRSIGHKFTHASAALKSAGSKVSAAREESRSKKGNGSTSTSTTPTFQRSPKSAASPGSPTFSLRGQIAELEAANRSVSMKNRYLFAFFLVGILTITLVLWGVYSNEVLSYAVIENLRILRDPVNEGRFKISFNVTSPGKVLYQRTSGSIETEVVDRFRITGPYERSWGWIYEPGKDTNVSLRYRTGMWKDGRSEVFPTSASADIVILMDTTGSMNRSIAQLKEKCVSFSSQLQKQNLKHRFALIGFGDQSEGSWLDEHSFTKDVNQFRKDIEAIQRFDGGDLPESALDALEQALSLPFNEDAIRRFYLVTDAQYHEPTASGKRASEIGARLEKEKVLLHVFSSPEYQDRYKRLVGSSGKFLELRNYLKTR